MVSVVESDKVVVWWRMLQRRVSVYVAITWWAAMPFCWMKRSFHSPRDVEGMIDG